MEELLRKAFQLGQQWVHDIEYNPEKEPTNFNEWFNSYEIQNQVKLFSQPAVSGRSEQLFCVCGNDRDIGNAIDENGVKYCLHCGQDAK